MSPVTVEPPQHPGPHADLSSELDDEAEASELLTPSRLRRWLPKGILLALVIGAGVGLWCSDYHFDLDAFAAQVESAGLWGPVIYVLSTATIAAAGFSMYPFLLTAGMVWSPAQAVLVAWLGTMSSSCSGFLFARYIARDWAQRRSPERFRRYDTALAERGFRTVLIARLILFTSTWMQLMMGASRVRFRDYIVASAIGNLPMVLFVVLLGDRVRGWWSS